MQLQPLANALPERTSPELQYLQTRFATLLSYTGEYQLDNLHNDIRTVSGMSRSR